MDRVLVTGGAGFIGSHLVDYLLAQQRHVTVLDNFSSGTKVNLAEASGTGRLRIVEGSILNEEAVKLALEDCSEIYHLAVQCVRKSLGQPKENHDINATGTLVVLEAARQSKKIKRFIYCSSSEVYGNHTYKSGILSEASTCAPATIYGASKLAGEYYTSVYSSLYGIPTTIVRPFNAFGPREHDEADLAEVIPRFVGRALADLPPVIFGDGSNGRDFTYVTDTVAGLVLAGTTEAAKGQVINLAYGRLITILEVAQTVLQLCGKKLTPLHIEERPGDVRLLHADTRQATNLLKFAAKVPFEEGLQKYIEWYKRNANRAASVTDSVVRNWDLP